MSSRQNDIDEVMLNIAFEYAKLGTCIRRDVGAIALDTHGRVLAMARNGSPKGYPHCKNHPCPGAMFCSGSNLESCEAVHAEMNLLSFLPDIMKIDTIYVTASPCINCIKALANSSCRRIVFRDSYPHLNSKDFWLKIPGRIWDHLP